MASEQVVTALTERIEALEHFALSNPMLDPRGSESGAMNLAQVLLGMRSRVVTLKNEYPTQGASVDDIIDSKLKTAMAMSKRRSTQEGSSWFKFAFESQAILEIDPAVDAKQHRQ